MNAVAAIEKPKKKKRPKVYAYARVQDDGSFVCEDAASRAIMRKKKIARGMLVRFHVERERDYQQWLKAHALGILLVQNFDDFAEFELANGKYDAHGALKKLQLMSGVECDQQTIVIPGYGQLTINHPRSLAFDEMDESEFQAAYAGFCAYIVRTWWHDMTQDQIADLAKITGQAG